MSSRWKEKFWPEEQKVEQNYLLNERGRNRVIGGTFLSHRKVEILRKALRCTLGAGELVILMKRFNSIKKNSEFQKVYRQEIYANKLLVMYIMKRVDDGRPRSVSPSAKGWKQRGPPSRDKVGTGELSVK